MPDIRKCCIKGCYSHSRMSDLRFFKFPVDASLCDAWLTACHKSAEKIKSKIKPLVCSRHFKKSQLGVRRLYQGSIPSLNLDPKPVRVKEELADIESIVDKIKREETETEQNRLIKLHYDSVIEWINRSQHHPNLLKEGPAWRKQLFGVSTKIRNLLGLDLALDINDEWVRNFQKTYSYGIVYNDSDKSKPLNLIKIINSIDPYAVIYNHEGISDHVDRIRDNKISIKENINDQHLDIKPTFDSVDLKMELEDSDNDPKDRRPNVKSETIISNYQQALEHLKPLEDFVLHRENFRAIGLLSTLESILKSYSK